ncbi:MAG: hypothetical protein HZA15_08955 [Nitrospirae bacterium]|nr:hypothetical protein [Nitrospirota bacterium]
MIRQLEKEMGSECGRITGKVITGSGAVSGPSVRHSSYVGSKPVCLGKTYLWNQRNERFEITKIWQEEGMDHIRVREHREAEERKYDSSQKYVAHMEILRFILEECDYSFSRPSDSKEWLLSAKGEKKVIERRPGMLVQGYKMLG